MTYLYHPENIAKDRRQRNAQRARVKIDAVTSKSTDRKKAVRPKRRGIPMTTIAFELPANHSGWFKLLKRSSVRVTLGLIAFTLLLTDVIPALEPQVSAHPYELGNASSLLSQASPDMAKLLKFDAQTQAYQFNANAAPSTPNQTANGGAHVSATAYSDPSKGISVTDPQSDADFGLKPLFGLQQAKQDHNRIVYPLADGTGWLVYTMQAGSVKEDILLKFVNGDKMTLKYNLNLGDALEAKVLPSGDIGVYGSSLPLNGNISTGSDKDAALLQNARKKAKKDKVLFVIPAPVIKEKNDKKSSVKASYELQGSELTLKVTGLKKGNYPLTIDPSVYVTSAQQFMAGNNESNIDYDTTNDLIQKGKLTGARIPSWTSGLALNTATWGGATVVGGGYIYNIGGSANGAAPSAKVYWAKLSNSSTAITSPDPGAGACTNWCTGTAYDLPGTRRALSATIYNGYLYAVGGENAACTTGAGTGNSGTCKSVYFAKIGANGEPLAWTATTSLTTERRYAGVVAYNNKIYLLGGLNGTSGNGLTTDEYASINPDGTIGSWTSATANIFGRWAHNALQYNGYIYLVGGETTAGTFLNIVQYIKINSDGSLASTWVTTNAFSTARMSFGGNFATIYGGYMYIVGGCSAVTSLVCSTFQSDMQVASINADGSVTPWTTLSTSLANGVTGQGVVGWRGGLYVIGGCRAMTFPDCSNTRTETYYGTINSDGDVSTIFPSPSSNFYTGTSYLSDLPAAGTGANQIGRIAGGVVINNGFIYWIGGCSNVGCTTMSDNTTYAQINSDGTLGAWTTDSTHTGLGGGTTGLGAFGITVYNNTIYTLGGSDGSGAYVRDVYRVTLNANGSLSANWAATANILVNQTGNVGYAYTFGFSRAVPNDGTNGYIYMVGGCTGTNGIGCSAYVDDVQRCTISNAGGAPASCNTAAQLPLATGTGIFGGMVYGNYVYMAGGANSLAGANVSPSGATCTADPGACGGQTDLIQYAMINSSGNITRNDGTTITGGWHVASDRLTRVRRRTTAFGLNGYLYVVAGHDGTTGNIATLNDIQQGKINVSTGDVTGVTALATTISDRWDLRAATANGYIYLLGGCTTGNPPSTCTAMNGLNEYVQAYNNWSASPASYTSSGNTPATDRYGAGATVMNGYIYLAGGCTSVTADCSNSTTATMTNNVTYAPLNADGSIGTWVTNATYNLPQSLGWGRLENVGGTLYYIGGQLGNGTSQTSVYYSTPSSGTPAAWSTASNVLPAARSRLNTAVYNGRIYAVAGSTGTGAGTDTNTVYYSPDLSAGGNITLAWTLDAGTSFQLARSGVTTVAYGNNLYVMGGFDGTNYLLDVQYAPIAADGSIGAWTYGISLPQALRQGDGFAVNGFMYIFGGRSSATTPTNNTYDAPINADGSIGIWSQTSVAYTTTRFGVAAAYDSGRAYLLGGATYAGAAYALTAANRAVYGTLQLQPQIAKYSLAIDTDTDVFPSKYLINGLDNGIGAAWYLNYQSSTSSTASWGQNTNVGKVTLGTPGTYNPLDGSGTNTNTTVGARYYYLSLTIDDQLAFGFPEDVSRGPNIYDITLQFASNPAKRLRNGKTFVGGVQQPLDTPF